MEGFPEKDKEVRVCSTFKLKKEKLTKQPQGLT